MLYLIDLTRKFSDKPILADNMPNYVIKDYKNRGYIVCDEKVVVPYDDKLWVINTRTNTYKEYTSEEILKEELKEELKRVYLAERDKSRVVAINGVNYEFECTQEDLVTFSMALVKANIDGSANYKAYVDGEKQVVSFTKEQLELAFVTINQEQWSVNEWYNAKKQEIETTDNLYSVKVGDYNG